MLNLQTVPRRLLALAALTVLAVSGAPAQDAPTTAPATSSTWYQAQSLPSKDSLLSFPQPGRIADMHVEEGQAIRAGELLAEQDSSVERLRLAELRMEAESHIRVAAAEAQLRVRQSDLERLNQAAAAGGATPQEIEHAELEVDVAQLSLDMAAHNEGVAQVQVQQLEAQIARMQLVSPIDGRVERIALRAGEASDLNTRVIRIVRIDPLWIEVLVPLEVGRTLEVGQPAKTVHVPPSAWRTLGGRPMTEHPPGTENLSTGRIVHVAAVAEAASDTLRVRVELPNPHGRPAGERVLVAFEPLGSPSAATPTND